MIRHNNSLERTPHQPKVETKARSMRSGFLRCMMKAAPLSSQPLCRTADVLEAIE